MKQLNNKQRSSKDTEMIAEQLDLMKIFKLSSKIEQDDSFNKTKRPKVERQTFQMVDSKINSKEPLIKFGSRWSIQYLLDDAVKQIEKLEQTRRSIDGILRVNSFLMYRNKICLIIIAISGYL